MLLIGVFEFGYACSVRMYMKHTREKGTQIVELAVVLPVLVLFTLIVLEGIGLVRAHQIITNAARESARMALLPENNPTLSSNYAMLQGVAICYAARNKLILTSTLPSQCSAFAGTNNCTAITTPVVITPNPSGTPAPTYISRSGQGGMSMARVQVTCGYKLRYLPRLPWFNISTVVPLTTTVETRMVN